MPRVHQRRKFDSDCLVNQTAPTAVNIAGEVSKNVCVVIRDRLPTKRLLQTEVYVQASKTTQTYRYTWIGVPQTPTRF